MISQLYFGKLTNIIKEWVVNPESIQPIFEQMLCRGLNNVYNGCQLSQHNLQQLSQKKEFGNFEIKDNSNYQFQIHCLTISYLTAGISFNDLNNNLTEVSALVMFPKVLLPKGVILYFHGTSLAKNEVPSNPESFYYKYCLMLASQGYIVIAPDYIGQGINYDLPHPYFAYPEYQSLSGLYLFKALSELFVEYGNNLTFRTNTRFNSYIYGHSEGATSAAFFTKIVQHGYNNIDDQDITNVINQSGFELRHIFLDSGIYNFTAMLDQYIFTNVEHLSGNPHKLSYVSGDNSQIDFVRSYFNSKYFLDNLGVNNYDYDKMVKTVGELLATQSKPLLMMYWLNGFCYYNQLKPQNFFHKANCTYLTQRVVKNVITTPPVIPNSSVIEQCSWSDDNHYNLASLFSNSQGNMPNHELCQNILLSALAGGYGLGTTAVKHLDVVKNLFITQHNNLNILIDYHQLKNNIQFKQCLNSSQDLLDSDWQNNIPITIITLDYDSVVNPQHSIELFHRLKKNSYHLELATIAAHNFWSIEPCSTAGWWNLDNNDFPSYINHSTVQPYSLLWMLNKINKL